MNCFSSIAWLHVLGTYWTPPEIQNIINLVNLKLSMIYIWRVRAFHFFNSLSFSAIQGHQITYQVQSRTSVMVSRRAKTVQGLSFGHLSHSVFAELYNNKYITTRAFIWNIISWKLAFLLVNATLFTSGLKRRKNYYRENQIWMILLPGSFDRFPGWWYCLSNEVVEISRTF